MPKGINLLTADQDVAAPTTEFGEVPPGTQSTLVTRRLRNTGDVPLTEILVWIEQTTLTDGEYKATVAGTPITGTTRETAQSFGPLAPGADLLVTEQWVTPSDASGVLLDTATLVFDAG